jgi:hypothetical protein
MLTKIMQVIHVKVSSADEDVVLFTTKNFNIELMNSPWKHNGITLNTSRNNSLEINVTKNNCTKCNIFHWIIPTQLELRLRVSKYKLCISTCSVFSKDITHRCSNNHVCNKKLRILIELSEMLTTYLFNNLRHTAKYV